ncbi:MAG: sigma-70 family RNA polymerase sigma factor [Thermoleophilia bacterium]|nr:sigma-70 family RNA polymerase sigma factor [Thermoleophilia bacterium]
MAEATLSSMHDARDAEDQRLLEAGELTALVESYYGVIIRRCQAKVRVGDPLDVAHDIAVRLLTELKRGRRYRVPFRVVVHQVTTWTIRGRTARGEVDEVALEEWMHEASTDGTTPLEELVAREGFEAMLEGLTDDEREVIRLRYLEGLDFGEIAKRRGKNVNAIYQIHHRALTKLRGE